MRGSFKAPEEAGSGARQGLPAMGRALSTAIRRIGETFGFYNVGQLPLYVSAITRTSYYLRRGTPLTGPAVTSAFGPLG